jgi:peptidoglycan-associated lipoprotein
MFYSRTISYTFLSVSLLTCIACAPSATKTDAASAAAGGSAASRKDRQSEGFDQGGARESNLPSDQLGQDKSTAKSSLDEMQAGKSTASSGPLKDIHFDYDQYQLREDARDVLKTNADWLKKNASGRVEIEGHCDERGTTEYNLALGAKRAQTAKDYLVTLGIATNRISTISYGEEIPACTEASETCWQQNRRARFVVLPSRPSS